MKNKLCNFTAIFLLVVAGCSKDQKQYLKDDAQNDLTSPTTINAARITTATVNMATTYQVIRGFGGASVWNGALTDADCDKLFTTLGLSICRVRIDPSGNWADEISNAQKATARGAIVFSSTWSPPAYMKSNNNTVGGYLLPAHYGAYTNWVNSFIDTMASNGVPLYAVSVQNEPNINVSYESCTWSSSQMRDYMVGQAGGINSKVMMPETFNYLPSYGDVTLNDPTGAANTDICAFHWYGANRFQLWTNAYNKGKDIWMTEYFSDDQTMNAAITTAVDIFKFLTIDYCNAYVWWYVKTQYCNLITDNGINPRGYVMGQFAKFVRPGSVRVDVSGGTNITAFTNTGKLVIVAINSGTSAITQPFEIKNGTVSSVTPHITDATNNMAANSAIAVTNGLFTATLPAKSVTTFVQP